MGCDLKGVCQRHACISICSKGVLNSEFLRVCGLSVRALTSPKLRSRRPDADLPVSLIRLNPSQRQPFKSWETRLDFYAAVRAFAQFSSVK